MLKDFGKNKDEIWVKENRISCDGGTLVHPKVYLTVDSINITVCPYCSLKFLKKDTLESG